jgi:hypothetical protein
MLQPPEKYRRRKNYRAVQTIFETPGMMFRLIAVLALTTAVFDLSAQVQQPRRIEIEMGEDDNRFKVVSAEEEGLVAYREVRNTETRLERKWEIYHLDTLLEVVSQDYYFIDLRYVNIGYEYSNGYFYMLFQQNVDSPRADLYLLRVSLLNRTSETFLIRRDFPLEISFFEVVNDLVIFGGYSNSRPAVICYEFGRNQPLVLPGFYGERSELLQVETDDQLGVFSVLSAFRTPDGRRSITLKTFDDRTNILKNITLQPSNERSLLYGRAVSLSNDNSLVAGTFTRRRSDMSRGLFLARIAPDGQHVINYYNFADLKNFFSYMKARKQMKIQEKIERKKVRGKKIRFSYRLLVHDILERDNNFIMIGEAFYPKYSNAPLYGYGSGYYSTPYSYMAFEGYKYTHAVVIGFDDRGRLLWDNSFEINDIISFNLEQYVHLIAGGDRSVLLYLYDNVIRSKIIEGTNVLEGKSFDDLRLNFQDDVISDEREGPGSWRGFRGSEFSGLRSWYGSNLYAFGTQKIKNLRDEGVKLNREVFFVNKISYE